MNPVVHPVGHARQDGERTGRELLHRPEVNKGTAYTHAERAQLGLEGLLPPRVQTQARQVIHAMELLRAKPSNIEKHVFLMALQDRNERLFYHVLAHNIEELMPIIYTPTVGEASQQYSHMFRNPRGLYICASYRGRIADVLRNWPEPEVRVIVVTDGERILGLGDLGVNGMGIPIGKLALYTAGAGIDPATTLPVVLDVGTNNEELRNDPSYLGSPSVRLVGKEYDDLLDEFVAAVQTVFPKALLQFEDFANHHAIPLLRRYQDRARVFNDDMQGTAAVALAGVLASGGITKRSLIDETILFLGAGTAGTGIADLVVAAMKEEGLSEKAAQSRCWFVDVHGLVVRGRDHLGEHNLPHAHDHAALPDLLSAVKALNPTVLIGVSGQPGLFTQDVVEAMAAINSHPVIFPLSNPTSKAECTAEQAYRWSQGRAVFAGGSPFGPVEIGEKTLVPGQGNNVYIFPGLGLGVVASGARLVTEEMFLVAARVLAAQVGPALLERGTIYPPLTQICQVSARIAEAVAQVAYDRDLAEGPRPASVAEHLATFRYHHEY